MSHVTTHHIVFTKDAQRHLNEKAIANNTAHILKAQTKAIMARGWTVGPRPVTDDGSHVYETELLDGGANAYHNEMHFYAQHIGDELPGKTEIRAIAKAMHTNGTNGLGGRWRLHSIDGIPYEIKEGNENAVSIKDFVAYKEFDIPDNFEDAFDHLYGLDSHIARVKGALEVAIMSQFSMRYHVALIGPPGCGKSDICETLTDVLGEDVVMKFDATATTAAGAIKQLDEAEILPRILVVEEIEKVNAEALSFLLALMDMRGEIRKTTAKKQIVKDTKILVIATVNNHRLFDNMLAGALSSRFANKCWFHRPATDVLTRILAREIAKLDGDEEWITPVLAYAKEKNINDPRMLSALCLCGRDGWLDGSYVKMLADTDKPQEYEDNQG